MQQQKNIVCSCTCSSSHDEINRFIKLFIKKHNCAQKKIRGQPQNNTTRIDISEFLFRSEGDVN